MTVNRADLNLSRFQFSCPQWWNEFCRGRKAERGRAINELSDWREADWNRARTGDAQAT